MLFGREMSDGAVSESVAKVEGGEKEVNACHENEHLETEVSGEEKVEHHSDSGH